jgi:hypothetical protein
VPSAAAVDRKAFKGFRQKGMFLQLDRYPVLPWMGTSAAELSVNCRVASDEPACVVPSDVEAVSGNTYKTATCIFTLTARIRCPSPRIKCAYRS